ncbi:MAG: polyamine aminopropyltransferase [Candidatus Eremiobacterota bacterium]
MDLWFEENLPQGWGLKVRVERTLASEQTRFQRIDLFETAEMGRLLVIDGKVQLSELDEFVYHEMLAHVALFTHPDPRRVMVVGGGDGGTIREVCAHSGVEKAYLVEIDERVIELSRQFLPRVACRLSDPRVEIAARDAAEYIRHARNLDAILVDSSDPVGPSEVLFSGAFYADLKAALAPGGMIAMQAGSPFFYHEQIAGAVAGLREHFPVVRPLFIPVPTYPSGTWSLVVASLGEDPAAVSPEELARRLSARGVSTRYYTPQVHHGALAVPPFMADKLGARQPV